MAITSKVVTPRHEHRLLGLMLLTLHLSVWWDFGGAISRSLMLAHLGLFLLWQPLMNRERNLELPGVLVFVLVTFGFVLWLNWGLVTFWLLLLTGFLGGRVTVGSRDRYVYLASLMFVVSEVLIGCIPPMFDVRSLSDEFTLLFRLGLLVVPFGLLFVPVQQAAGAGARPVDFLYGLMTSLLTIVLGLGSLLSMYLTNAEYAVALIQTVLIIAFFLLAISWLWTPLAGFAGLGQLWERYLLNIGTPFEDWLSALANIVPQSASADAFLDAAMHLLADLPWVAGVEWRSGDKLLGKAGSQSKHAFEYGNSRVDYVVYTHRPMGVALQIHCKLLLRLVAHFRLAKQREREIAKGAQLQAVYETGARVTHDIKNLLQSLRGLTVMVENEDQSRQQEVKDTLKRQLPHLANRLQLALDKLQAPGHQVVVERRLDTWWAEFKQRNDGGDLRLESDIVLNPKIPVDLFDSVVENLLENARNKRQSEPEIDIFVRLESNHLGSSLSVGDSGTAIDAQVAEGLFKAPVKSRNGLGIGLYQAAVQANQLGYTLKVAENNEAGVRFELTNELRMNA